MYNKHVSYVYLFIVYTHFVTKYYYNLTLYEYLYSSHNNLIIKENVVVDGYI